MLAITLGLNEFADVHEPDGMKRLTLVGIGPVAVRFVYGNESHLIHIKGSKQISDHLRVFPKRRRGAISVGMAADKSISIIRGNAKCTKPAAGA